MKIKTEMHENVQLNENNAEVANHIKETTENYLKDCMSDNEYIERKKELSRLAGKIEDLNIEILNSTVLPHGLVLIISPQGIKDSLRNANDGFVYFGSVNLDGYVILII